jgi:hypothetical protein
MLRWIVHQQMNVVVFASHVDQLRLEILADVGEDGTKASDRISVEDPISVFCDEDQIDVKLKHAVSTVSNFT